MAQSAVVVNAIPVGRDHLTHLQHDSLLLRALEPTVLPTAKPDLLQRPFNQMAGQDVGEQSTIAPIFHTGSSKSYFFLKSQKYVI